MPEFVYINIYQEKIVDLKTGFFRIVF